MPSLLGSIVRVGWWAWLPSIYIADLAALAGGHRDELGNQVSSVPWGVAGFIIAFTVFVGLGHWRRARRYVSASSALPSSKPLAGRVPPPSEELIDLDYPDVLSHLQGLIGCRLRVGFARWPESDPIYGYLVGYLRLATPGWTLNHAYPEDALGFTLTHTADGAETVGGFVVSAPHLRAARGASTGAISLTIDHVAIAIAPDRSTV